MSPQKRIGFPRFFFGCASVLAMAGGTGCASSGGVVGHATLDYATVEGRGETPVGDVSARAGFRGGEARVVGSHVNPMVPVRLTLESNEVAVRFTHSRTGGAVAHLDRTSLAPVGDESPVAAERPVAPSKERVRVVLTDGRFIVCWKAGDVERGYRVMAQGWTGQGEPMGAPVPISPADSDILGALQVVAVDGHHAVAAFAAMTGDRAEVLAVSLEIL